MIKNDLWIWFPFVNWIALRMAVFSAWNTEVKGGRERGSDDEREGIQIAAPTLKWLFDPSVKMRVLSENFCCMSCVKTIWWDEVIESGNLWKGIFWKMLKNGRCETWHVGSLGMNFSNYGEWHSKNQKGRCSFTSPIWNIHIRIISYSLDSCWTWSTLIFDFAAYLHTGIP